MFKTKSNVFFGELSAKAAGLSQKEADFPVKT